MNFFVNFKATKSKEEIYASRTKLTAFRVKKTSRKRLFCMINYLKKLRYFNHICCIVCSQRDRGENV